MRKTLKKYWVAILFVILISGGLVATGIADEAPKRDQVVCTCGCKEPAVKCGCGAAVEALKKFDEKFKGV